MRLDVADLGRLPYADGEFTLVVCFDAVAHLEDPGSAFDEIVRVLAADGVLLVSTSNSEVQSPANPHHRHQYLPEELGEELRSRLSHVRMMRQDAYLTVAVLDDADFLAGGREFHDISLHKLATGERDTEEFTVAVAGRNDLPELPPLAVMASALQVKTWLAALAKQRAMAAADHARILELEEKAKDLTTVPQLQSEVAALTAELARVRDEKDRVIGRAETAERVLSDVWSSLSWRLTSPLRRLKGLVRSPKG